MEIVMKSIGWGSGLAGALAFVVASAAAAQTGQKPAPAPAPAAAPATTPAAPAPSAPPAAPTVPDRTTASFGDWVLRCDRQADATPPRRFCELSQTVQRPGDAGPLAQIAIGRILPTDPLRVTALLPINVSFQPAAKLVVEGRDGPAVELGWLRCLPAGCFASTVITDEALKKLRAHKDVARLEYRDGSGREVVLGLSFRGFGEAFEAFVRESSN